MKHKEFLFYILNILEKNEIPYFLFCGTLLGAVRDKDFLSSDTKDTDIAVDDKYYWKVRYLINKTIQEEQKCAYYFIWRKEISIINSTNDIKVDIFFLEKEVNNYYMYSYKSNPETKRWDYEWRVTFNYENFYPLNKIKFLGKQVNVPKDYKKVLEEQYGTDWEVPKPTWISSDKTLINFDSSYPGFYPAGITASEYLLDINKYDIGFICINFIRTECTKKCINSLKLFYPNVKIYVADQDTPSGDMIEFYEKNNVEYYYVPYDCGLSYCRNFLLERVKEPFLMWGDNDFIFDERSNISHGLTILNNFENIGFVGGGVLVNEKLQHYERLLCYHSDGILVYIPLELTNPSKQTINDIDFYYCDLTFNYVLCKTSIVQNNPALRWNENLKVAYEHTSMFLCINQFNAYKVVYCPSMLAIHAHSFKNTEYNSLRKRKNANIIFGNIWNLKMNFTIGQGREIYQESNFISEKELVKQVYTLDLPKETFNDLEIAKQTEELKKEISTCENRVSPKELFKLLYDNKINFWLLKNTCRNFILKKEFSESIEIGTNSIELKDKINRIFPKENIDITVEFNRKTKDFKVEDYKLKVPYPVLAYLKDTFGENWNK